MRHINVLSDPRGDGQLERIDREIAHKYIVSNLEGLGNVLDELSPGEPATLDLIGHSSSVANHQLKLGQTVITTSDRVVADFFGNRKGRLHELRMAAVRLLGCCTAESTDAQATVKELAQLIDTSVYGAITTLSANDYEATGLEPDIARFYLRDQDHLETFPPCPVRFEATVAALVPSEIAVEDTLHEVPWPRLVLPSPDARELISTFSEREGGVLPGLLVEPDLEIVIPTGSTGWRTVHVLFGGRFVRVAIDNCPDGALYRTHVSSLGDLLKTVIRAIH